MSTPLNDATLQQNRASDPAHSTWLSANAGSGKTRVLTDRVTRLLIAGAAPETILCLTYTKAAASEMQNRLFDRLGKWAMLPDRDLREALRTLGHEGPIGVDILKTARRLFARAIETPGGLKIQTIHSFCASLLRRFPLEAGLTPGFREMEERETEALLRDVLDHLSTEKPDIFRSMVALVGGGEPIDLCMEMSRHRAYFREIPDEDALRNLFGLGAISNLDDVRRELCAPHERTEWSALAELLSTGNKTAQAAGAGIAQFLRDDSEAGAEALDAGLLVGPKTGDWIKAHLLKTGVVSLVGDTTLLETIADRAIRARLHRRGLLALEKSRHLFAVADAVLPRFEQMKADRGLVDFDDLIHRTSALLSTPGLADWVLYKLDGGIEHILIDEAQDTAPLQWEVIESLTREFTSGEGRTEDQERTLFVVGDLKQSIYSFQGADPSAFGKMRKRFHDRLDQMGKPLEDVGLKHSFRSSPTILDVVDHTFADHADKGIGETPAHRAFHGALPGRVDLWPQVAGDDAEDPGDWFDPVDRLGQRHPTVILAEAIAEEVGRICTEEVLGGADKPVRRAHPGDILILVQSRGPLFRELIAACKAAGLPVAGADKLALSDALAAQDVLSLLSFLILPDDDLSLAEALRSPLFGWSEKELHKLAAGRGRRTLWQVLRSWGETHPETVRTLTDLLDEADFLRPYEMIDRILSFYDGRRKLLARLGEEAAEALDVLLNEALRFETTETPSLTGFVAAMRAHDVDVKRSPEGRGDKIRVMTVHGAKGLESPIVILPDTGERQRLKRVESPFLAGDGAALPMLPDGQRPQIVDDRRQDQVARQIEESQRLLYVAMTRAEQWLIVCGTEQKRPDTECWYKTVSDGLESISASAQPFAVGNGFRHAPLPWPQGTPVAEPTRQSQHVSPIPDWATRPAPTVAHPPQPRLPSDLGGAKVVSDGTVPDASLAEAAKQHGTDVHLLLEHLPGMEPGEWERTASRILKRKYAGDALTEAKRCLTAPEIDWVFAPDVLAEVDFHLPGDPAAIEGTIDRLSVSDTHVRAADFKTNRVVPTCAKQVPEGLLRQMGAYAHALEAIYPGRSVEVSILWTATAELMVLPHALVMAALQRAGFP